MTLIYVIYVKLIEPDYFVSIKIVATCTNKQPREKIVLAPYQKFCSWPNSPAAKLWITTKVLTFWVWQKWRLFNHWLQNLPCDTFQKVITTMKISWICWTTSDNVKKCSKVITKISVYWHTNKSLDSMKRSSLCTSKTLHKGVKSEATDKIKQTYLWWGAELRCWWSEHPSVVSRVAGGQAFGS